MKVTTCLTPLHTALAVYGCLLGYTSIAAEMQDAQLKKLVENYDFSAVQWFEQHGSSLRHTMPPERFARLSEALERYDFERAAKLLDEKEE